jgi:hypothetical protein
LQVAPPGVRIGDPNAPSLSSNGRAKTVPAVLVKRPPKFTAASSKRIGLAGLGSAWRAIFWREVKPASRYCTHIAALTLTGARSVEFGKGIRVRFVPSHSGGQLVFTIRGAKRSTTTGLAWRRIAVDVQAALNDPNRAAAVAHLIAQLQRETRQRMDLHCTAKALNAAVSAVGIKAFPRHAYKVSPYSFRHQLATDIKEADIDKVEVARILSHASTRTADHYGYASRSRGALMRPKSLPIQSGGVRGKVRIKHSAPPNWPSVRSRSTPTGRLRRKKP